MKILAILLSVIYYLLFGIILLVTHALQWLSYNLGGYKAHHKSVIVLDRMLMAATRVLGTSYKFSGIEKVPHGRPLIIVSNHQSMFDINPLQLYFEPFHPKFISKIELGKGIPSVSYNLRKGGSVLIDRKDSEQAVNEIKKLGGYIEKYTRSAIIFPEGTRSRDGKLKHFHENGIRTLIEYAPSALIVPVTINNSWKLMKHGNFPLGTGVKFTLQVHTPLIPGEYEFEELMTKLREEISSGLKEN